MSHVMLTFNKMVHVRLEKEVDDRIYPCKKTFKNKYINLL